MTRVRTALALVALATGIAVALVVAREGTESALDGVVGVAIGWSFVATGLVAWARRPDNPIGQVMVLGGLLRLGAEFCTGSNQSLLFPLGHLLHPAFWIAVGYVLLAFPSGRLDSARSLGILAGAGVLLPLRLGWLLLGGSEDTEDVLALTQSSDGVRALERAEIAVQHPAVPHNGAT